jgi:hypothetical protein
MRIHPAASLPDSREAPDLSREVNLLADAADAKDPVPEWDPAPGLSR